MEGRVRRPALKTGLGSGEKSSFGPSVCPFVSAHRMNLFSSAAFDVCFGTMTYVKLQIGYASGCRFDGSTTEIPPLLAATRRMVAPAALIEFSPGIWNRPARF